MNLLKPIYWSLADNVLGIDEKYLIMIARSRAFFVLNFVQSYSYFLDEIF